MPKLIIDDISIDVPGGTTVLEAARSVGITIPHFCWHPALGRAGACRVCAVKLLDGPVKGVQMSCMLPAQDGMVVSTTDAEAAGLRRQVIEWLMINHPHDCPVCDEGGECRLQDFTIAGGHGLRCFDGKKRTYTNQGLGPYIEQEMNRCIHCYRCSRFYQEYAGGTDFGVMGRSAMVCFGRHQDGALESPFSGNLADICPTGVFTDKTARFRARYWDYDMAPSVCPHCSLGCSTIPAARYRELLKVIARTNAAVNGWFICDRGRFSNCQVNAPDRPRQAMIDGAPVGMDAALDALADRLNEFMELHGSGALAIIGSPRMSLEGNLMAARLRDLLDAGALCYFSDTLQAERTGAAVSRLHADTGASQEDVRQADMVVVMADDLLDDAPMMALAVRQAWRNGGRIFVVGADGPSDMNRRQIYESEAVASLADIPFGEARAPVVICDVRHTGFTTVRAAVLQGVKIAFILDGPNSFGCGLLALEQGALSFAEALAAGKIKGVISLEADLPDDLPREIRVLVGADWLPTHLLGRAEIVLPATSWVEMTGTFVNNEGRAQRFNKVMQPGAPIRGLDPIDHPPRLHRHDPPGGDILPTWRMVAEIMERLGGERITEPFTGQWERVRGLDAEGGGMSVLGSGQVP